MIIYIDYFCCMSTSNLQKFNGGNNYANNIITALSKKNVNIKILCPNYCITDEIFISLFRSCSNVDFTYCSEKDLIKLTYVDNSVYYMPVLYKIGDFKKIEQIKKVNHSLKVCATIHDLRMLDYISDKTEKYYLTGFKRILFPFYHLGIEGLKAQLVDRHFIKNGIKYLDEIYTVSNYAMQNIIKIYSDANVKYYYQSVHFDTDTKEDVSDDYILFVSGGRRLKNFSHALGGFIQFKKHSPENTTKLVVTGIDEKRFKSLCEIYSNDRTIIENFIEFHNYVSNEELDKLYSNCKYLLYVSKMEGFGLPVLEAARYGKTSIASNRTAIPEVLGAAIKYVNPLNDAEIASAIEAFDDSSVLEKYKKRVKESMIFTLKRMDAEERFLTEDIISVDTVSKKRMTKWN